MDDSTRQAIREHLSVAHEIDEMKPLFQLWTMVSEPHLKLAVESMNRINRNKIPGDVVECGVWKGGMTMAMILINQKYNTDRHFYLFDTFEGLPEPTKEDGEDAKKTWDDVQKGVDVNLPTNRHRAENGKWNLGVPHKAREML